jgi:hypothetical protein
MSRLLHRLAHGLLCRAAFVRVSLACVVSGATALLGATNSESNGTAEARPLPISISLVLYCFDVSTKDPIDNIVVTPERGIYDGVSIDRIDGGAPMFRVRFKIESVRSVNAIAWGGTFRHIDSVVPAVTSAMIRISHEMYEAVPVSCPVERLLLRGDSALAVGMLRSDGRGRQVRTSSVAFLDATNLLRGLHRGAMGSDLKMQETNRAPKAVER